MREEATTIRARDGYPLSATVVQPAEEPRRALVVNGAMGVPKEFYRRFARYAAEQGYAVLLYDYRGIGGSRPASLRGFAATMRDWGAQDMSGALDWLHATYAGLPLVAVGHSVGGQLLGLMPNHGLLRAWRWLMALVEHEIHHRSQLAMYLTLLGVTPPHIFGLGVEDVIARATG